MARILLIGLDGAERSFQLQTNRPFTVGRDPGNDIVLRDPKVSRHHAEIVFDRGFFVVHDLASANGTWVNGKKIRVAPLTHGAKMRMGNTFGRFSEELSTEGFDPDATRTSPEDPPFDQAVPPTEDLAPLDMLPTSENPRVNFVTMPSMPASLAAEVKKK